MSRFNSVVLDVDSTLSGIEGIDWLAALRGPDVQAWSAALTERAMAGKIPIEAVYGERMSKVRPARSEIEELGRVYIERMAPHARETLVTLQANSVTVAMVSGGLREAILPLATTLSVDHKRVCAVSVFFDAEGNYAGFDETSPLTQQTGKRTTVQNLGLRGPVLAVGDGMTDCEIKPVVQNFAAFTGFTRRDQVIQRADFVIDNFDQLRALVLE
ncbi:MAG: HAD-IB family phosphatase [Gemmatimonadaceae bacterium]